MLIFKEEALQEIRQAQLGASKYLERMARGGILDPDEA